MKFYLNPKTGITPSVLHTEHCGCLKHAHHLIYLGQHPSFGNAKEKAHELGFDGQPCFYCCNPRD